MKIRKIACAYQMLMISIHQTLHAANASWAHDGEEHGAEVKSSLEKQWALAHLIKMFVRKLVGTTEATQPSNGRSWHPYC